MTALPQGACSGLDPGSGVGGSRSLPARCFKSLVLAVALLVSCLTFLPAFADEIPAAERKSGYEFMGPQTRAMQDDDTANPAMLAVLDGEALWNRKLGPDNKSCADCHGDAALSMKGIATRYPAFSPAQGRPVDLAQRINICRTNKQNASPLPFESKDLPALTAFVASQSRGLPIEVGNDERTHPFIEAGREIFYRRQGQLDLACAQCHNDHWSERLGGSPITQAQPTGYPIYRLEWQSLGSLQRRMRNCIVGMRAEAYVFGSPEYVNLELYLMWRARGMKLETPAVRP